MDRWKDLLRKRTFWVALAMIAVPVVNSLTGRSLQPDETTTVVVGLGAILVKLLFDDVLGKD